MDSGHILLGGVDHRADQVAEKAGAGRGHGAEDTLRVEIGPVVAVVAMVAADQPGVDSHRDIAFEGERAGLTAEDQ